MDEKEVLKALQAAHKALDDAKATKDKEAKKIPQGEATFSFKFPKDLHEVNVSNLKDIPKPDPVVIPPYPKEMRVSNLSEIPLPEIPKFPEFRFPESIGIKKPAWLPMLFVPLRPIKELLEDISEKIKPMKWPTKADEAIPVRLTDGKNFINQLTQWVQTNGGGGGSVPKVRLINGQEAALVVSGLSLPPFDATQVLYDSAIVERYLFYQGGLTGQLVSTVTIEYTDSTKDSISTVVKT